MTIVRPLSVTLAAVTAVTVAFLSFVALEPVALKAQDSQDITISQTITGETSFTSDPTNVSMDQTIASITGGTSNGTTSFTVQSNNASGYNVTMAFEDDASMQLDGGGAEIPDYIEDTPGTPDYGFGANGATGAAQFGFSVLGATAGIVASNYRDNNTDTCGVGAFNGYGQCWSAGSTTDLVILDSSSPTAGGGDESSVLFRVHVPATPSPAVPAGDYTATATLTVTANP